MVLPSGTARGRAYLYHSLGSSANADFNPAIDPTLGALTTGLVADGWEVFGVGMVHEGSNQAADSHNDFDTDATLGLRYRNAVLALHDLTKDWIDYTYGPPPGDAEALFGESWGGLSVELLIQSGRTFRAWACHLPATNPSVLTEMSGDDVTNLHPDPPVVGSEPGWISYGTSDTRVGYVDTQALAEALQDLNPAIEIVPYAQGHVVTSGNVNDIVAFFEAIT